MHFKSNRNKRQVSLFRRYHNSHCAVFWRELTRLEKKTRKPRYYKLANWVRGIEKAVRRHLPFSWTFSSSRVFSSINSLHDLARISLYRWDSFEYSPPSALSLTALTVSVTLTVRLLSFPDEPVIFIQIRGTDPRDVNFWSSNSLIFPLGFSSPNFCKTTLRFVTQLTFMGNHQPGFDNYCASICLTLVKKPLTKHGDFRTGLSSGRARCFRHFPSLLSTQSLFTRSVMEISWKSGALKNVNWIH